MGNIIDLNTFRKYRQTLYVVILLLTAFVTGAYFRDSYLCFVGIAFIVISLVYELKSQFYSPKVEALILPEVGEKYFKLQINSKESDFLTIRKSIIINSWVYVYFKQEATNIKIKLWLHKLNFQQQNDIRKLARFIRMNR
ncbi:hypothetical protein QIW31_06620 [Francisellaceae bacterium CB299]|jgi:hypothetical protein